MFKGKFISFPNDIIIGERLYKVLKSSNIVNHYYFINKGGYKIIETNRYPIYNIRRTNNHIMSITKNNNKKELIRRIIIDITQTRIIHSSLL
jgi:hypothetical protein